jgi:hypothetical protein
MMINVILGSYSHIFSRTPKHGSWRRGLRGQHRTGVGMVTIGTDILSIVSAWLDT